MSGNDIDRTLADWFKADALAQAPADGVERALEGARRRRPRPGWLATLGSHWVGDGVRPSSGAATLGRTGLRTSTALLVLLVVLALVAGAVLVGARLIRPAPDRLGIFEPIAGKILSGVWAVDPIAVDPANPSSSASLDLGPEKVLPVAWSSDGTRLLFMREDPTDKMFPYARHLFILDADGTETQLNTEAMDMWGAAIAPDGSRVVFAATADDGEGRAPILFTNDSDGGEPDPFGTGSSPTFSPDGKRIAYITGSQGPGRAQLWVANADGSDAHEIQAPSLIPGSIDELTWSPAGDRLALVDSLGASIFTVTPDGSGFATVISGGLGPVWSPDGSQIAYTLRRSEVPPGELTGWWVRHHREYLPGGLAIADADGSLVNVRGLSLDFGVSGPWHPDLSAVNKPAPAPSTDPVAVGQLVLQYDSSRGELHDGVAAYADGRVIWGPDDLGGYLEQRLTHEGLELLRSRALSTGLFESDLLATAIGDLAAGTDVVGFGYVKVIRGDRPVIAAWGRTPDADVSGHGVEDRWVHASSTQAAEVIKLDNFLRNPTTWGLADEMYVQRELTPFVPSHLWVSYDRGRPDWSQLPSPARELVTRIMGPGFMDGCSNISLDQAREMAQVLTQAGVRTDYDDRLGLSFSCCSSFVHAHPALPHDVGTVCGE